MFGVGTFVWLLWITTYTGTKKDGDSCINQASFAFSAVWTY